jgi:hypothetical protein
MNSLARIRISFGAVAVLTLVLGVGLLAASHVSAQSESISISRITNAPGADGTVDLSALGIGSSGLGAWEIGILYDPALVTPTSCSPQQGGVCNLSFASNQIQVVGASASGLTGDTTLANITFECGASEGTSPLTLVVSVLADATPGGPQPLSADVANGSVTCTDVAGPAPRPTSSTDDDEEPAPTEAPVVSLPETGSGSAGGGSAIAWLTAVLASTGLIAIVSLGALRLRARQR